MCIDPSHTNDQILEIYDVKLNHCAHALQTIHLAPSEIFKGFLSFWWPSLKYMAPFANIHLHSNILQPLYRNLLPKIKVNRHFPSTMAASSPIIGGLGLPSLEVEQAVEMISLVMSLFPASVATSFYLRESLELLQLESGIDSPMLGADFDKLSFLTTPCWMHHL